MRKEAQKLEKGDIIQYGETEWRTVWSVEIDQDMALVELMGKPQAVVAIRKDAEIPYRKLVARFETLVYSDGYVEHRTRRQ